MNADAPEVAPSAADPTATVAPPPATDGPGSARGDAIIVVGLVALSLLVRLVVAARTHLILPDGVVYATMAEQLATLDATAWGEALRSRFPPLFPLLAAPLCRLGVSGESATLTVSLVAGALVAIPAFALGRALAPGGHARAGGVAAGVLAAAHPYLARPSGEVLADSTFHLLALGATAVAASAFARDDGPSPARLALVGVLAALGWLARPEGLAPALVAGVLGGLVLVRPLGVPGEPADASTRSRASRGRTAIALVALAAAALIVGLPYLVFIRAETGRFAPTLKKDIQDFLGVDEGADAEAEDGAPGAPDLVELLERESRATGIAAAPREPTAPPPAVVYVLKKHASVLHPLLLPLILIGVVVAARGREPGPRRAAAVAGGVFALYALVLLLQKANVGYLSNRHVAIQAALAMPFAALGLLAAARRLASRRTTTATLVVAAVVVAVLLPKTWKARYDHKVDAIRALAASLRAETAGGDGDRPLLVGRECRVLAHLVGARYVELGAGRPDAVGRAVRGSGARWLVIYLRKRGELSPELQTALSDLALGEPRIERAESDDKRYSWLVFGVSRDGVEEGRERGR